MMHPSVASNAICNQGVHHIASQLTPVFHGMDLQISHGTALLAAPTIPLQRWLSKEDLIFGIKSHPAETRNAPKKPNRVYNAARSGFREIRVQAHGQEVAREPMVSSEFIQAASSTAFDPGRGAGLNANLIFKQSWFSCGVFAST
jgi:hypothetical protein